MLTLYKKLALILFGGVFDRYIESFKPLESHIRNANMKILLKTWVSAIFLTTFISFIISFAAVYILLNFMIQVEVYLHVFTLIGPSEICTIEKVPRKVDISEEVGIEVKEVTTVEEALEYFID